MPQNEQEQQNVTNVSSQLLGDAQGGLLGWGWGKLVGMLGLEQSPLSKKHADDPLGYTGTIMGLNAADRAAQGLEQGLRSQGGGIAGFFGNVFGSAGSWFKSKVAEDYFGMAPSPLYKMTDGDPAIMIPLGTALDTGVDALQRTMETKKTPQSAPPSAAPDQGWKYSWEGKQPYNTTTQPQQPHYDRDTVSPPAYTSPPNTGRPGIDQEDPFRELDREVKSLREREEIAMPQREKPGIPTAPSDGFRDGVPYIVDPDTNQFHPLPEAGSRQINPKQSAPQGIQNMPLPINPMDGPKPKAETLPGRIRPGEARIPPVNFGDNGILLNSAQARNPDPGMNTTGQQSKDDRIRPAETEIGELQKRGFSGEPLLSSTGDRMTPEELGHPFHDQKIQYPPMQPDEQRKYLGLPPVEKKPVIVNVDGIEIDMSKIKPAPMPGFEGANPQRSGLRGIIPLGDDNRNNGLVNISAKDDPLAARREAIMKYAENDGLKKRDPTLYDQLKEQVMTGDEKYIAGAEKAIGLKPAQEGKSVPPESVPMRDPYRERRDAIFEKAQQSGVFKTPEDLQSLKEMLDTATPRKLWQMEKIYGITPGPGKRMNYETPSDGAAGQRDQASFTKSGLSCDVDCKESFERAALGVSPAAVPQQEIVPQTPKVRTDLSMG